MTNLNNFVRGEEMLFNHQEQRYNDLWAAVEILKNGVGKIKERGRKELDLILAMQEEDSLLSEKKEITEHCKRIKIKNALSISSRFKDILKALSENRQYQQRLTEQIKKLDEEIDEYIKYTDSFTNLTFEEFCYLLNNRSKDYVVFEAIILLSINNGMMYKEKEKVINKLKDIYDTYTLFEEDDVRQAYIGFIESHLH